MPSTPSVMRWGNGRSVRHRACGGGCRGVRHILIDARYATAPVVVALQGSIVLAPNVIWWAAVSEPFPCRTIAHVQATPPQ